MSKVSVVLTNWCLQNVERQFTMDYFIYCSSRSSDDNWQYKRMFPLEARLFDKFEKRGLTSEAFIYTGVVWMDL